MTNIKDQTRSEPGPGGLCGQSQYPEDARLRGAPQPMAAAPKDGTWILAFDLKYLWRSLGGTRPSQRPKWAVVRWENGMWLDQSLVSHGNLPCWMFLPEDPPKHLMKPDTR